MIIQDQANSGGIWEIEAKTIWNKLKMVCLITQPVDQMKTYDKKYKYIQSSYSILIQ